MPSLRERLASLQPADATASIAPAPPVTRRPRSNLPIAGLMQGNVIERERGSIFRTSYTVNDLSVAAFDSLLPIHPSFLVNAGGVTPEQICFLDTETTGLAGGTGTLAFLIGIGHFEDGHLHVRQYFMQGPADESVLLELISEELAGCRVLVTFNGRTFDWPLIETRYRMHRREPAKQFDHFDVLHPARRIWRARLGDCSLGNLESQVLLGRRELDVPGYLIPQLYFDYLRDGDARRLLPIFAHNRQDIVSMTRLSMILLAAAHEPARLVNANDRAGMGLLLLARGDIGTAISVLQDVLAEGRLSEQVERRVVQELTLTLKRMGRAGEALPHWRRMCDHATAGGPLDLFPFEELAKYYEHQAGDIEAATRIVRRAVRLLEFSGSQLGRDSLIHRLRRLERKRIATYLDDESTVWID